MTEGDSVAPIDFRIATTADPTDAWRAITDPARAAEWFTDATALGPVGSPYRLDFGGGSIVGGTVLRVEPGRSFSHSWHWEGTDATETTTVTWTVEPGPAGGSHVRLVHDGWHEAGLDAEVCDSHEAYWSGYPDDLLDILGEA